MTTPASQPRPIRPTVIIRSPKNTTEVRPHSPPPYSQPIAQPHTVNTIPRFTLPAHFNSRTSCTALHNFLHDSNLDSGLPTPIGYLDTSAALSFQWGQYQDLSNLYCLASAITKLHSTSDHTYTVVTNAEVDNYHHHSLYPSRWTNLANRGSPPRPGTPNHSLLVLTWQNSHFGLLHLTQSSATWVDSLHHSPPPPS